MAGVIGAAACGGDASDSAAKARPADYAGKLPQRLLMQRYNSGFIEPTRRVITDADTWEQVWNAAFSGRRPQAPFPKVDFRREMLVIAAMGTRPSGGYTIHVDSVVETDELVVHVRSVEPGAGCGTTSAISEPVYIAAVRPSALPTRFVEVVEQDDCRDTVSARRGARLR